MRKTAPKKKMNRKMKRTIRKSLSALFMATAMAIAAIPVQENTAANVNYPVEDGDSTESEPLGELSYPDAVTEMGYGISYDENDYKSGSTEQEGIVIVHNGAEYVERKMYKLRQLKNGEYAIVGYNKNVTPKDNGKSGTLVIPATIASEYPKFEWADVEAEYYQVSAEDSSKMEPNVEKLQKNYDLWHPDNVNSKLVDFSSMSPDVIGTYALNLYACDKGGTADCIAESVRVIDTTSVHSVYKYVPYDTVEQKFMTDKSKTFAISVIGANAFSTNAFSETTDQDQKDTVMIYNLVIGENIIAIGDSAFAGCQNLESLSLGINQSSIGNHAFQNCAGLREVHFEKTMQYIGAEAFRGCNSLSSITLTGSLREIGEGAFADCGSLKTINMSEVTSSNKIDAYAFYNATSLNDVKFSDYGTTTEIQTCAFAVKDGLSNSITGSWKNIEFPDKVETFGASVLEGRTNLETCILPQTYGANKAVTLDGGFFRRCINLKSVTIKGPMVKFATGTDRECNPFWWVDSEEFYVEGPPNLDGSSDYTTLTNYSYPRSSTQRAHKTFKFTTKAGVEYFEIAVAREDDPDTDIDESKEYADYYLVNAKTNALECYTPDPNAPTTSDVVIRIVGNYNGVSVKSVAEGCFDSVKDRAVGLIVDDNTIEEISEKAFADFIALKYVELGNSITKIGEEAFAGCLKLSDVTFGMDDVTIEKDAFKTLNTDGLTFHGKIEEGFEPFDFAMNKDNDIDGQGLRILYTSLEPSNIAVVYDNGAEAEGKPVITMISYPIYKADDSEAMIAENALYEEAVKKIVIPSGITSIDSSFYYKNGTNTKSIYAYVAPYSGENVSRYLAYNASIDTSNATEGTTAVAGIFSGVYDDFTLNPVDGKVETLLQGNDFIESVEMSTVKSLPDFAFDSCENLKSVILGEGMEDLGVAPFRNCTSLAAVGGNSKFICENSIIYEKKDDGTYKLIECLPGRANNEIKSESDPLIDLVSEIEDNAFQNCTSVQCVDLRTATELKVIPENCFNGCTGLKQVYLPESVNEIRKNAFSDIKVQSATGEWTSSLTVRIPATEVYINSDAFDKMKDVTIETYEDTSAWRFAGDNGLSRRALNHDTHLVKFLDWDFEEIYSVSVPHDSNVIFPSDKQPSRTGYKFTGWRCLTSGVTIESKILDDYVFVAQYNPINGTGTGSGSGSGSGVSGNSSNSGTNSNGSSTDTDKDKDKDNSSNGSKNLYTVSVVNGSGSGSYEEGATVIITANEPATGKQFKNWTTDNTNITLASTRMSATTFTMPAGNVTVTANYEDKSSSSSSTSSSSSSGSTVSGNSSNRTSANGTKVIITRPGISDTDLAAAKVNGSKDGFIVKISETAEATAAVEAALINKYGSLDNIRYCAMDISLYDSTGTTKITDTTGLTIDITIPLPDALKEYAGNNKVAAIANSQLENLSPKFTTIDGVPCVTFKATHFSPYTIYVDTQDLSASGTLDSTPKTGDGIHPKWFLSIGLACISIALFMKKDKKVTSKVKVA